MILLTVILVVAIVLLAVGFLAPRRSKHLQAKLDRGDAKTNDAADEKMPKPLDKLVKNPVHNARKVADRSTELGRKGGEKAGKDSGDSFQRPADS